MSRPTDIFSNRCDTIPGFNYFVIGNTMEAVVECTRLYNETKPTIILLTDGPNHSSNVNLSKPDFPQLTVSNILNYLVNIKVKKVYCDSATSVHNHYFGSGINGNLISAYYTTRVGPWYTTAISGWDTFVQENTSSRSNTAAESQVISILSESLGLEITSKICVDEPSILNRVCAFVQNCGDGYSRHLFFGDVSSMQAIPGIEHACNVCSIRAVKRGSDITGPTYMVEGPRFALSNVKLRWKVHPYVYLKLKTTLTGNSVCAHLPAFYRTILSIPQVNDLGVNLSGDAVDKDFISSFITFCYGTPCNGEMPWKISAYTTLEDLSQVNRRNVFASPGNTLLIVEGICGLNLRKHEYNARDDTIDVKIGPDVVERSYLEKFAEIVAEIHLAYTGVTIPISDILVPGPACNNNVCTIIPPTVEGTERVSPLQNVVHMAGLLFGHNTTTGFYPTYNN